VKRAARVPFVALVSLLLVAGVAGLLFFNTHMQQTSFTATALEAKAQALAARKQSLTMQLETLRNPQRVALRAKRMGMVPPSNPAFIRLSDGAVLGSPAPATFDDSVRLTPAPTRKPKNLRPRPIVVQMKPAVAAGDAKTPGQVGAATTTDGAQTGTKKSQPQDSQESHR
jgi:hypothetical protein